MPQYGRFGGLFVRYGKSSKGGPPKRRTVLTVPELDWSVGLLEQYLEEVRPAFSPGKHPALWITERRGRMSARRLDEAFETARKAADLPEELDILDCQPGDLIEVRVVNEEIRKTADEAPVRPLPTARRTTIRRPEGL